MTDSGRAQAVEPRGFRALIDQGLNTLAREMYEMFDEPLTQRFGADWPTQVADEIDGERAREPLARLDLITYQRLLEAPWSGRDFARDVFDRERYRQVHGFFREVRRIRNQHAHPDVDLDTQSTAAALGVLHKFALTADLKAVHELGVMLDGLDVGRGGDLIVASQERVDELRERLEAEAARSGAAERAALEASAEVERARDQLTAHEEANRRARTEVADLRREIAALKEGAATESTRIEALKRDLARAEEGKRLAQAALERAEVEIGRRQLLEDRAAAEAEQVSGRVDDLATELTSAATPRTDVDIDELRRALLALSDVRISARGEEIDGLPEPGEPWPYVRGTEVWALSARGTMHERDGSRNLKELVDGRTADRLIAQFLQIRPSGGRVWIDDDGDASTYIDGDLIYLGRIQAEVQSEMALGTPLGSFSGSKYEVRPGRVTDRRTSASLASVKGRDIAREVSARLLRVRPRGGVYRVNREGVAATWVDGQWVYAGRVVAAEWFPGQVD